MDKLVKRNILFPEIDSFFDDFFRKDLMDWKSGVEGTVPSVNVNETDKGFEIEMAAPGMKREDFKIQVKDDVITISSERKEEKDEKDQKGNYTRREFSYQSFSRSFSLPQAIERDSIEAAYDNGILNVTIDRKKGIESGARSISVK
ncbi:MAG: hypothetical protein RL220_1587 [Bacteroidota bacterium]|jgi:HSP20 family protein